MSLIDLLPPGSVPEGDSKTREFFQRIDGVFAAIVLRMNDVFSSTPSKVTGPLYADWQRITGSDNPQDALRRRCDYFKGMNLSNTREHFLKVDEDNRVELGVNKVVIFLRKPIITGKMRSLSRIGRRLQEFKRPKDVIKKYEKMRHAHVIMEYKNA